MRKTVKRYLSENREQKEVIDGKIISKDIFGRATIQTATGTFKAIDLRGKGTTGVKINNAAQNQNEFAIIAGNQERNIIQPTYYDLPSTITYYDRIVALYNGGFSPPDYDHNLDRFQIYDLEGNLITEFYGKSTNDYFYYVTTDEESNFYITMVELIDYPVKYKIQKFNYQGNFIKEYSTTDTDNPLGAIDYKDGYLYVTAETKILKMNKNLEIIKTIPINFSAFYGLKVDSNDNILVSFGTKHVIRCYDQEGNIQFTIGKPDYTSGSGNGEFNTPYGIALDSDGNIYVCDYRNKRIQKFNSSGAFSSKFSFPSGYPQSIALNTINNDLYITDNFGSGKIQVYDATGQYLFEIGIDLHETIKKYEDVHFCRIRG